MVRHPSLSYGFATPYVGGSSQSPRPDEGTREAFLELEVALEQLAGLEAPTPELLWGTLRHFLADASGNPHRSELNIEKLHNPFLPGRGQLGLVELRALSMAPDVEHAVARALLLRGIVVMLQREDRVPTLTHWHEELHDRFALPWYLRQDLREVFADLASAGLALGPGVESLLLERPGKDLAQVEWLGVSLRVEQALEFWPLVGDVASQEGGGSRLVDASTARLQLRLSGEGDLDAVQVFVNGCALPMRDETGPDGRSRVMGVRYRSFCPFVGLHPGMPAEAHVQIELHHASGKALRLTLHPWRPDGTDYPTGLPADLEDAAARREERATVEELPARHACPTRPVSGQALTPHCLDLRRVPGRG